MRARRAETNGGLSGEGNMYKLISDVVDTPFFVVVRWSGGGGDAEHIRYTLGLQCAEGERIRHLQCLVNLINLYTYRSLDYYQSSGINLDNTRIIMQFIQYWLIPFSSAASNMKGDLWENRECVMRYKCNKLGVNQHHYDSAMRFSNNRISHYIYII